MNTKSGVRSCEQLLVLGTSRHGPSEGWITPIPATQACQSAHRTCSEASLKSTGAVIQTWTMLPPAHSHDGTLDANGLVHGTISLREADHL